MKEPITKFDFEDAFKALDDIPVPTAEKGIRANRQDLRETMRRVDKFELLFEDFYDVNDSSDMEAASEEREAEVAKAKLARIEKIVDLDAKTEDDILPSYVGKIIIQCPQCMTLFYKNPEDIQNDEENPDTVNVNETCQHCGNTSGYEIIGKVAEETTPVEDTATSDSTSELDDAGMGDGENDISVDDTAEEGTEETSDESEVDELSAEVDLDELDLDNLEFEEEEEEKNESLNLSKALKDAEEESDLKTENGSKKLTLNEDIDENLDDKLKAHDEYISHLRATIEQEETALNKVDNEQIKASIQGRIDALKAELEAALPDAVKVEAPVEDTEVTEIETLETEETVEETAEETPAEENETEEKVTEALNEAADKEIAFMDLTGSLADCEDTYQKKIEKDGFKGDIRAINDSAMKNLVDAVNSGANVVLYTCDDDYKTNCKEIVDKKNFKVVMMTKEALTESLTEADGISANEFDELIKSKEFQKPVSEDEVRSIFAEFGNSSDEVEEAIEQDQTPITEAEEKVDDKADQAKPEAEAEEKPVEPAEVKVTAEINKNVTEEDVKKLTEITDIDEASFNKKITESLKTVYENVKNFTMTNCSLNESTLVIEGTIAFKSGRTKTTSYIFEAIQGTDLITLTGSNKDLFETGKIDMTCNVLKESLQANTLNYKYTIGKDTVEGLIK
jgi:hypothetical protein